MTTAPRLRTLLPDVAVQRASCRESAWGSVIVSPPWGRGRAAGRGRGRHAVATRSGREMALVAAPQLGARLPDRIFERVGEGGRRGGDDVGVAAHRRPRPRAVHRIDDDPRARRSRRAAVEDAHLVVDEVDFLDAWVERTEGLAVDLDLDRRLGQHLATVALLDQAGALDDAERGGVVGGMAADQQLEAGFGALEREAVGLELLDQLRQ